MPPEMIGTPEAWNSSHNKKWMKQEDEEVSLKGMAQLYRDYSLYLGCGPLTVTVTTRIMKHF